MDNNVVGAIEKVAEALGNPIPKPTISDAGKVLVVGEDGKWKIDDVPTGDS